MAPRAQTTAKPKPAAAPPKKRRKAPAKAATAPAQRAAEAILAKDWEAAETAFFALAGRKAGDREAARIFSLLRERAARGSGDSEAGALELLLLGVVKLNEAEAAHTVFDRLIEVAPDDANLPYRKALLYFRTGKQAEAAELWETLRARSDKPQELLKMLAQCYMLLRDDDRGVACAREAVEADPRNGECRTLLAKALMLRKDYEEASQAFRRAMLRDPGERDNFSGLIASYGKDDNLREAEKAATFFVRRFPAYIAPKVEPGVRVLLLEHTSRMLLTDARYGRKAYAVNNMVSMMSNGRVAFNHLYVDLSLDPFSEALKIPPCDVVFNNAANAELLLANKGLMLQRVKTICSKLDVPVINPVERVVETTRRRNFERFHEFPGIVFPKTIKLTFDAGREEEVIRLIKEAVPFPLILRQSFTHADTETDRIRDEEELRAVLPKYAGKQAYIIQYIDCSDENGIFRRYRAMFVGDRMFPSSLLACEGWNVHGSASVDLMDKTDYLKTEERRYQSDMESVVGKEALDTFWKIRETLGLDYFGIDYNFDREGRLVIFEINPSMNLAIRDRGDFPYLKESNEGIKRAMEDLMLKRANSQQFVPEGVRRLFA
jgi:tetratricopeptide (TPR) repeat protein